MKISNAPQLAPLLKEIRQVAADAVTGGVPPQPTWSLFRLFADTGDRLEYERLYFRRRRALNALAVTAMIDGAKAEVAALADLLWSICDEYTWAVPAHAFLIDASGRDMARCVDLFACETAQALSEIVTELVGVLPPDVAERVRAEVERRVLEPYVGDPRPWPWETARNNWVAVCAGAAGMAAMSLWTGQQLDAAVERCRRAMHHYLTVVEEDGGAVVEGVGYWSYGFGYFAYFAEALRERTGEDLLAAARATAAFPAAVQLSVNRYPAFSDSSAVQILPTGLFSRIKARLGVDVPVLDQVSPFDFDHCYRWAHLSRTLSWTDGSLFEGPDVHAQGAWLERAQWLVERATVNGMPVAFAAKGGHNDESHNHNDLGHFILEAHGEELLADLGAGEYTEEYFGPGRYEQLHPSAQGHSVPLVHGRPQRPGRDSAARVLRAHRRDDGSYLELDLTAAYDTGTGVCRAFAWKPDGTLEITDTFDTPADVDELFISRLAPEVGTGHVIWRGAKARAVLRFDASRWHPHVEHLQATNHLGAPDLVHRLRLTSTACPERAVFAFTLEEERPQ
ncbi:heparinase II/III domain-containing protein [Streptomyces sp. NPDC004752]